MGRNTVPGHMMASATRRKRHREKEKLKERDEQSLMKTRLGKALSRDVFFIFHCQTSTLAHFFE